MATKVQGGRLDVLVQFEHTGRVDEQIKTFAAEIISKTAFDIEAGAKQNASGRPGPNVITGTLRNNIRAIVDSGGLTARVVSGSEYGAYVEYGTFRSPAYPYFVPAVEAARPKFQTAFERMFNGMSL